MLGKQNCSEFEALVDRHIDGELNAAEAAVLTRHTDHCPACERLIAERRILKTRLRQAALQSGGAPAGLGYRIRQQMAERERPNYGGWRLMALAATVLLLAGVTVSYQNGYFRFNRRMQDAYVVSIGKQISPIMRVGLNDHVHCAYYKKYADRAPTVETLAQELGPKYADLIPILRKHLPSGYAIHLAHICTYHGRPYVHLAAHNGRQTISLLVAVRGGGEAFENDLHAVASEAGVSLYTSGVQRFSLAGFETRDHLVYLASEMDSDQNLRTLQSMASELDYTIRRSET